MSLDRLGMLALNTHKCVLQEICGETTMLEVRGIILAQDEEMDGIMDGNALVWWCLMFLMIWISILGSRPKRPRKTDVAF